MSRSSDYYNRQNGWDTTSHDYHSHVSRMRRMPSVMTDVPHYPNVHKIFNNNNNNNNNKTTVCEEDDGKKQHDPPPAAPKKVQFVEPAEEEVAKINKKGNHDEVFEESIDVEADSYIQQKRKNFEICKWTTFKMT